MHGESEGSALDQRLSIPLRRHVNETHAALQGATTAFNASLSRGPSPDVTGKARGAVAAAVLAGSANRHAPEQGNNRRAASPLPPEAGSVREKIGLFAANQLSTSPRNLYDRTVEGPIARARTPQQIAARLAAERSPSRIEKGKLLRSISSAQTETAMHPQTSHTRDNRDYQELPAPKPIRRITPQTIPIETFLQNDGETSHGGTPDSGTSVMQMAAKIGASVHLDATQRRLNPADPQKPRRRSNSARIETDQRKSPPSPPPSIRSRRVPLNPGDQKPQLPARPSESEFTKPSKALTTDSLGAHTASRSHGLFLEENGSAERPLTPSLASVSGRSQTTSSSILNVPAQMDEDALSDAIVASSLASSRASPAKNAPPPPPPRRRQRSRSLLHPGHSSKKDITRSPSPLKGLRQTLREPPKKDEEEGNGSKHRMHLIRKHPHKHHEGDRRRWRSEITERERKRYEGVWAANKGLLIPVDEPGSVYPPNASEMVLNLVVRDIWSRSRLPSVLLEQVWDLVDRQKIGLLTKEEFVVGMWLIDQQLKGHKLPVKVPESVWYSVKNISGIAIKPP